MTGYQGRVRIAVLGAAALIMSGEAALAGAFQLNERSARSQGMSFADSVSGQKDITYIGFNPAALRRVETLEMGGNLSIVFPISEGETTSLLVNGTPAPIGTAETLGFTTETNSDRSGVPLAAALGYRVNDDITIGFAMNVPFGLTTENPQNFIGAFDGTASVLTTFQMSPMFAVDVFDSVTLGAAMNFLFLDARLGSNTLNLDGDDATVGFSAGAIWEPTEATSIGIAYHHGYDLTVNAEARFTSLAAAGNAALAPLVDVPLNSTVEGDLPATIQLGVTQGITDDFRMSAEFRYINWSVFDELTTTIPALGIVADDVQNYEDAVFAAVGGEYDFSESLTGRVGFAYDQTPTQDGSVAGALIEDAQASGRTVRVPDASRLWFSAGASYDTNLFGMDMTLDAGYSYLLALENPEVVITEGPFTGSTVEYDGGAHIVSVGGTIRF